MTLSDTDATVLPSHNFSVTVTCDAATQVGLKAIDGRSGTIQENARAALNTVASDSYGLGAVDGTNIGAYNVRRTGNPTADGSTVALLISRNHGSTWAVHENNAPVRSWPTNSSLISWGATDGTTPGSYSSITEQFSLTPAIAPTSALPDLTNSIPLDGLATFEVRYL